MPNKSLDDDLVMSAVDLALASPAEQRDAYIRAACGGDSDLIEQVRKYVELEERLDGFLEEPLFPPPPDEPPFQRGDLLADRFDILGEVGEGGMGWVYEAWDKKLERRVAIKCAKSGFHKRLPPEVAHAREIAHDNVCKVFEIHTVEGARGEIDVISMEFLKGETLAARLQRGGISRTEALGLARQICDGLAEAHRNGVVHGDVKGNNVIITKGPDGAERAVITDFGLARRPGMAGARGTAQSMAGGAMDYMAPEIWKGEKATPASDVYGLGVILCELFAGRRPFGADTPVEERFRGKPPSLDWKWDRVLAKCLDPDPARRFQSAGEVEKALKKSWRWYAIAAAAGIALAAAVSAATYQITTAPQEVARLAVLPFAADLESTALSQGALLDTGNRLSHLKSSRARRLTVIPVSDALQNKVDQPAKARTLLGATLALTGEWRRDGEGIQISAHLIDTSSLTHLQDWQATYSKDELPNAPIALAGMVTSTLRLPPLAAVATVNAAAYPSYSAGAALARRNPDVERALPLLQRAVDLDPASPLTHAKLAEAQWAEYTITKDPDWQKRALASLAAAKARNGDVLEVLLVSGTINSASGWFEEAKTDLLRALDLDRNNGDVWRQLGHVYEDSGQSNQALDAYRKAIDLQPDYFKNHLDLGAYYFNLGDYEDAARQREQTVTLAPDMADAHYALAAPYLNMGRYADAEYQLNLAKQAQDTARVEMGFGLIRLYQDQPEDAISYFEKAVAMGPASSLYYIDLGTAYRRAHRTAEANAAYEKGLGLARTELKQNPLDGYSLSRRAYLNACLNNREDAETDIEEAIKMSRNSFNVRWMGVQTYEYLEEHDQAVELLKGAPASMFTLASQSLDLAPLRASNAYQRLLASHNSKN